MLIRVNLSSNLCSTGVLPPLIPPMYWGETGNLVPSPWKGEG